MDATVNQKAKRKNKSSDVKLEPAMKALKKDDIILQFNCLQEKFEGTEYDSDSRETESCGSHPFA